MLTIAKMVVTTQNHRDESKLIPNSLYSSKKKKNFREIYKLTSHEALNNWKINYKRPKNMRSIHLPKRPKSKNSKFSKKAKNLNKKRSKKRKRNIKNAKKVITKTKKVEKSRLHRQNIRIRYFRVVTCSVRNQPEKILPVACLKPEV